MVKSIMEDDVSYAFFSFANSFMFCTAVFSIFYPLHYKFGYLKMHIINLILFYGLIFIPIVLNLLKDVLLLKPIMNFIFDSVNCLMKNPVISLAGCAILYIISIALSVFFQNNKLFKNNKEII
jgi:hypothetical protein